MNAKSFADALGQIGDSYLTEADAYSAENRKFLAWKRSAIACAACLVLMLTILLPGRISSGKMEIYVDTTSVLRQAAEIRPQTRAAALQIPIQLRLPKETTVAVSDGILLASEEEGQSLCLKGSCSIEWIIPNADPESSYRMQLQAQSRCIDLAVSYDTARNAWVVQNQS